MERIIWFLQGIVAIFLAPLWLGFLWVARNRFRTGRWSGSPWRFYKRWWSLIQDGFEVTQGAPAGQYLVPALSFISQALIALMIPIFYLPVSDSAWSVGWSGDLFMLFSLLSLPLLAGILWLDPRLPFTSGALGRQTQLHVYAEPILLVNLFSLSLVSQHSDIAHIFSFISNMYFSASLQTFAPASILILISLWYVLLALCGRIPFDDPDEDAELTTQDKGSDYSFAGVDLALMEWSSAIRLGSISSLLLGLYLPFMIAHTIGFESVVESFFLFIVKMILFLGVLGYWEGKRNKIEFSRTRNVSMI